MFASLGWGIFSALSGLLVSRFSIYTAFQLYFVLEAFAIIPVCFLRFHARPSLAQVSTYIDLSQVPDTYIKLSWLTSPTVQTAAYLTSMLFVSLYLAYKLDRGGSNATYTT